ncbi:MAG: selenide, water dikinase [Gaiellales bacterium]|nr:selenide, water dikinase [Gaiellales bacterium]
MATETIRLTQLSHGAGCACKLPAGALTEVLRGLPLPPRPDALLVGPESLDDAAVWRLSDELAVVHTVDFFTPIVDDPFTFGLIAATNAISDVYAMGATPAFALNVVAFPKTMPMELLGEILRGGLEAAGRAGVAVAGGHSIDDAEPKYGMAVVGFVHPDHIWTNTGGQAGDVLVFSKAIGTGIVATAIKQGAAEASVVDAAVASMTTLNDRAAAQLAEAGPPHAVTDVTGFGLVGHARELANGSGLAARIRVSDVPLLPGVRALADRGVVPGGTRTNLELAGAYATFGDGIEETDRLLVCDAQTAGGLLAALPRDAADRLGWPQIGELVEGPPGTVLVD